MHWDHWDHWDAVAVVLCLRPCFSVFPSSQVFSGLRSLGVVETHIGPATRALPTCRHAGRVGTCWNCWNHGPYRDRKWQTHHKVDQVAKPCWNFRTKVLSKFEFKKCSTGLAIHFVPFQDSNWPCPVPDPSLMVHRARPSGWTNARSSQVLMPETWKQKQEKTFFWTTLKSKHKCVKKWKLRRLRLRSSQRPVRCETAHVFSERMLKEQSTLPWLLPPSVFPLHIFFRSARNPPGTRKSRGKMATSHLLWLSFNPVFFGVHGRALLWRTEFAPNHGQRGTSACFVSCRFWCSIYVRVCEWCLFASCRDCCRLYFLSSAAWNHLILGLEAFTCLMWQTFNRCFPKPWSKMS